MMDYARKHSVSLMIILGALLCFVFFALTYHSVMGDGIFAFTILPIIVAASLLGMRAGIIVGLFLSVFNLLASVSMGTPVDALVKIPIPVGVAFIFLGAIVGSLHDVTAKLRKELAERKKAEEKVEYLAYHDSLTTLPNRTRLMEILTKKRVTEKILDNYALLFLDLDRFKWINEAWGHEIGDNLLKMVAHRLTCLAGQDAVFRFGGDEFVIIRYGAFRNEEVELFIAKIFAALNEDFVIKGKPLNISTSIGVVFYPRHGRDILTLLKNADIAMNHAKNHGKKTYQIFNREISRRALRRTIIENGFYQAIRGNELTLQYQPIINLQTGRISRVEALVRWNHPDLGLIMPGGFIGIAEETEVIWDIDEWVFRNATLQLRDWHTMGFKYLNLAINLSANEMRNLRLRYNWNQVLRELGIEPNKVELEITEDSLVGDERSTISAMHELKKSGIRLAIDDFGKGYSSLAYLRDYPIDTLKIDRTFTFNLEKERTSQAIVRAVIEMGNSLGLNIVGEGVETEAQLKYLQAMCCDEIQGYLFSPPVNADVITKMLREVQTKTGEG